MTVGTSTLQMNISGSEEKCRNKHCVKGTTCRCKVQALRQALCFVHQLGEKGNFEGVHWPLSGGQVVCSGMWDLIVRVMCMSLFLR